MHFFFLLHYSISRWAPSFHNVLQNNGHPKPTSSFFFFFKTQSSVDNWVQRLCSNCVEVNSAVCVIIHLSDYSTEKEKNWWVCHVCALLNSTSASRFFNFIFSHFTCFWILLPSHTSLLYHVTINFICLSCENGRACSCGVSYFTNLLHNDMTIPQPVFLYNNMMSAFI